MAIIMSLAKVMLKTQKQHLINTKQPSHLEKQKIKEKKRFEAHKHLTSEAHIRFGAQKQKSRKIKCATRAYKHKMMKKMQETPKPKATFAKCNEASTCGYNLYT